jgi:cytochrome bd-type quinol oxidase subunit 1
MENSIKTFNDFKAQLVSDPNLQHQFKEDPVAAIKQFKQSSPLSTDKWIYRIIVLALGLTILAIIFGVIYLIGNDKIQSDGQVPTILTAIGSAAIGALAGLLAPPPKTDE